MKRNSELEELEEQLREAEAEELARETEFYDEDLDEAAFDGEDLDEAAFDGEDGAEADGEFEADEEYDADEDLDAEEAEESAPVYRNYANGYGTGQPPAHPARRRGPSQAQAASRRALAQEAARSVRANAASGRGGAYMSGRKRRRGCGCGCLSVLVLLVLAVCIGGALLFIRPPASGENAVRKRDTATILLCGTDADGIRTDTMMLLYLSGSERQAHLLSLPRDTYTITASGKAAKLNSAYGRNGQGQEGMDVLLDDVRDIIGYRPDGYVLVDFTLVSQIVDLMGGVDVEVPMDMDVEGVVLSEGMQHLTGRETLALLRFRQGYAAADLKRIQVQRAVVKACMEQWLSLDHIGSAMEAISMLKNGSISTLSTGNYLWIAKTLALGMQNFQNDTLPGYADYRDGVSFYILDREEVAELINGAYNPYPDAITPEKLNIAG